MKKRFLEWCAKPLTNGWLVKYWGYSLVVSAVLMAWCYRKYKKYLEEEED